MSIEQEIGADRMEMVKAMVENGKIEELAKFLIGEKSFEDNIQKRKSAEDALEHQPWLSKPTTSIDRKKLWMLCRNKYNLIFDLCASCNQKLYQRKEKVNELRDGSGVIVNFELCWDCVGRNIQISEVAQEGSAKWKKYGGK